MNKKQEFTVEVGGQTYTAVFSDLADQADGAVMLRCNETVVFATAVMSKTHSDTSWFNLTVDFQEKYYAGGQILGGRYKKREGKPSDASVLASRAIDRTLRPLFDHRNPYSVQVIVQVLALDHTVDLVTLAINAVSLALHTSSIPWRGPVGACRYGKKDGVAVVNSSLLSRQAGYDYDLIVCGRENKITMIEADAFETPEEELGTAFDESLTLLTMFETWQQSIQSQIGKEKKVLSFEETDPELVELFKTEFYPRFPEFVTPGTRGKDSVQILQNEWNEKVAMLVKNSNEEGGKRIQKQQYSFYDSEMDKFIHESAIVRSVRSDGRSMNEVRGLYAQAGGISKRLHGSGIFYRGETHVLNVATLGGPESQELVEGMELSEKRRFMHHYNFPPFSAGETGRAGFTNRREIGHGALAEKALEKVLPSPDVFPYTIRLVSESMASNGSTSQASICAGSLALMDAGVPTTGHIAGIAMGLMYQDEKNYKVLTDVQGLEDHYGDMDFKVAGTEKGICAIQLDIKLDGVSLPILKEAMKDAKVARATILEALYKEIPKARSEISPFAPKIVHMKIDPSKIGLVIGSGGKTVNEIRDKTGTEITIEDDGQIFITGLADAPERASVMIAELTREFSIGDKFEGEITKIADFGAFVRLNPFTEGMVHISEIAPFRVEKVGDYLAVGQTVPVVVVKKEMGKIGLSIKEVNKDLFKPKTQAIPTTPKPKVE